MKNWITILKGLAILAVVFTHVLSSLPPRIFTAQEVQVLYIFLDQSFRFCVPLFVVLSGYALSQKYQNHSIKKRDFFRRRFGKLLPLYILWSLLFITLFAVVPSWNNGSSLSNILTTLLLGRADYHLYFVPMIFQLYVLFPILQWCMKQRGWRHIVFVVTLVIQLISFYFIGESLELAKTVTVRPWLAVDQHQYILFTSWIGYFGLGMWLSHMGTTLPLRQVLKMIVVVLFGLGWWLVVTQAIQGIRAGGDPLYEMRFTRYVVLLFAASASYIVVIHQRVLRFIPEVLQKVLIWLGSYSFLIYLSHTLFLRVWFSRPLLEEGQLVLWQVGLTLLIGIVGVALSLRWKSE